MSYEDFAKSFLDIRAFNGSEVYTICPFHEDTSPSFAFNVKTGLWICHACGVKGNARHLAEQMGTTMEQGLDSLKSRIASLDDPEEQAETLREALPETWLSQFRHETEYWEFRGISRLTQDAFDLGFDPFTNSATVPLRDNYGKLLGVVRRRLDKGGPKYVYPKGFKASENLFGSWKIEDEYRIAIVEGPVDALACWDSGIPAVALYGSHISDKQIKLIKELNVATLVILTDNDAAGRRAAEEIVAGIQGVHWEIPIEWPEGAKDPGDIDGDTLNELFASSVPFWHLN